MTQLSKLRIIIIDDHDPARLGFVAIVQGQLDMEVVAEASQAGDAVELFRKHRPDIVLMDMRFDLPGGDGLDATRAILQQFPDACIIAVSAFDGDCDIRNALDAGVKSYYLKGMKCSELLTAMREVHRSKREYLPNEIATILGRYRNDERLSEREIEVLEGIRDGKTDDQIAKELANLHGRKGETISPNTVKMHRKNVFDKLSVKKASKAVDEALKRGIIWPKRCNRR